MTAPFASASEIEEAINSEKQAARGQLIVSVRELTEKASSASTEGRLTTATWHRLKAAEILGFVAKLKH